MLSSISWTSFFWMLIPLVILYYLLVLIFYYRKDLFSLQRYTHESENEFSNYASTLSSNSEQTGLPYPSSKQIEEYTPDTVHELIEDLKFLFVHASKTNMVKEELVQAVRSSLKKYPGIGQNGYLEDLNWHITQEARENCRLELLPEDLKRIWSS
jgi:hypothetical protein